ncbi:hypothetical protein [Halopelagius fulvigenes]|uniref:Uncharacterized protein n=1 Tax=Halopelagius fulvigenes TaxID=1198324 RepID=A0ABD5U7H4_9EURY
MRRISKKHVLLISGIVFILSIVVAFVDCKILVGCSLPLLSSLLSIVLSLLGTVILAIPSLTAEFEDSAQIREAKEHDEHMRSAYEQLKEGKELEEGRAEFEAMTTFLQVQIDIEQSPSTISGGRFSGALKNHREVLVDGKNVDISTRDIQHEMMSYSERVDSAEEFEDEEQERRYVEMGCLIYGEAIFFQALSTVLSQSGSLSIPI